MSPRLAGLQCFNMCHNGKLINLYGVVGLNIFYFKRNRITNKHKAYEWLSRRRRKTNIAKWYGVAMILMGNEHAGGQSNLVHRQSLN